MCCVVWLAWCGTTSKVNDFLEQANDPSQQIQTTTGSVSGNAVSSSSDDLLAGSSSTDESDILRWMYKDYTLELLAQAKTDGKKVIIVVYDDQNDNCVKLDKDINTSLGRIPWDVVILKLPYVQATQQYTLKDHNTVIYMDATGKITNTVDGGIYTMDTLLYYL